jgi:FkbH-like protein
MLGRMHKCLVLDLDGTLWGGIIGEDGIHGIALGPEADGRPYYELQQWLLALYERGIVLAINSRNNFADAMDVIRNHPHCLLRERHFAAVRINWQDKASNLVEIAQELNIGLDSLVFLDDDPVNRALVRQAAPAVYVVDLPKNPACFLPAVQQLDVFDTLQLTREDLRKSQQYSEQAQRSRCREASGSLDEYLAALQTVLTVKAVGPETLARAAQLTQKTNQFNVTTRRYLEADLLEQQAKGWRLYIGAVKDRFGDSGWTALAIVEPAEDTWRIDTFLLSCRIIGRGVEEAMLSCICRDAAEAGASCITGEFVASPKNQIAASFYASAGFQPIESAGELRRWLRPVSPAVKAPLYITLSGR